ncbi:MAG: hypothetical protein AAGB12_08180 [Pseudomonadota bacterium]
MNPKKKFALLSLMVCWMMLPAMANNNVLLEGEVNGAATRLQLGFSITGQLTLEINTAHQEAELFTALVNYFENTLDASSNVLLDQTLPEVGSTLVLSTTSDEAIQEHTLHLGDIQLLFFENNVQILSGEAVSYGLLQFFSQLPLNVTWEHNQATSNDFSSTQPMKTRGNPHSDGSTIPTGPSN